MAENLNIDGNIEVYPGPRGFSVVDAKGDGTNVRFVTDEPRTLNPVALPRGAKGEKGVKGDPGQASIRVDETVGYRVFLWEIAVPSEQMVYGDTGVRAVTGGTVRRTGNTVETTVTDPSTLPAGFKPAVTGAKGVYLTAEPWPTALPGTKVTDPTRLKGLEGYDAATANGYPGTAQQWLQDKYRVIPSPEGVPRGQVLTRTETGLAYAPLPQIGPEPWRSITLDSTWRTTSHLGNLAQTRTNNGRVDWFGHITYTGPTVEAGMWSTDSIRVGVVAPQDAPKFNLELAVTTYEGASGAGRPVPARLNVSSAGVMQLMCYSDNGASNTLRLRSGVTQIGLTGLTYAIRDQ